MTRWHSTGQSCIRPSMAFLRWRLAPRLSVFDRVLAGLANLAKKGPPRRADRLPSSDSGSKDANESEGKRREKPQRMRSPHLPEPAGRAPPPAPARRLTAWSTAGWALLALCAWLAAEAPVLIVFLVRWV